MTAGRRRSLSDPLLLHATCVSLDRCGVLIRGPSGSGKSDLALRLIDRGALLVADDLTAIRRRGAGLVARLPPGAPAAARGRIEVRGIGLLPVPAAAEARLRLVVELAPAAGIERLPAPETADYLGVCLPLLRMDAFTAAAAAKVRLAARAFAGFIMPPS